MSTSEYRVHKIDDRTLCSFLGDLRALFPSDDPSINIDIGADLRISLEEALDGVEIDGRYGFRTAAFHVQLSNNCNFSVNFERGIRENNTFVPSAVFDGFRITFGRGSAEWDQRRETVLKVYDLLGQLGLSHKGVEPENESDVLRDLLVGFGATHRKMLDSLNSKILELDDRRIKLEEDLAEREKERLKAHEEAQRKIEEEREQLQLESYRAERRKILQSLTDEGVNNLRKALAPRGAVYARWAVFSAAILLSVCATFLAYISIDKLSSNTAEIEALVFKIVSSSGSWPNMGEISDLIKSGSSATNWYLIIRSVLSSLVAVGALLYAATWMRSFYNSEMSTAREIDRFNYDLIRASWAVETILEVKHEHGAELPEQWVQGVTRSLFQNSESRDGKDDGVEALRALMGFTASASFGPDGPKFDIGRKDAKKLSKTAPNEG